MLLIKFTPSVIINYFTYYFNHIRTITLSPIDDSHRRNQILTSKYVLLNILFFKDVTTKVFSIGSRGNITAK